MNSALTHISGLTINEIPFTLTWVGDLLFFDWSIISVMSTDDKRPFIKAWVESKDDVVRYALFEVDTHLLGDYIFGVNSYLDMFLNPTNSLIFIVDTTFAGELISTKILSSSKVPRRYIPKTHVLFDKDDCINLENIIAVFELVDNVNSEDPYTFDILNEAKKNESELINLHLASQNEKVGFGRVESQTLGEILIGYNRLAEETALNIYDQSDALSNVKNLHYKKDTIAYIKKLAATEYTYDKAASFSVFLTPIKIINDDELNQSSTEKILTYIFNLFSVSADLQTLEKANTSFSPGMILAFSNFLKSVRNNDITLTVQYGNPFKRSYNKQIFTSKKSDLIIKNLASLEKGDPIESKLQGKFTLLDRERYKFRFITNEKVTLEGKFDKKLFEFVSQLNLIDTYDIGVMSTWERKVGNESKSEHSIFFCYKSQNSTNVSPSQ